MRAPFRDTLERVIATAAERIGRQYKSESPVDVLAADILRRDGRRGRRVSPGPRFRRDDSARPDHARDADRFLSASDERDSRTPHRPADPRDSRAERDQPSARRTIWTAWVGSFRRRVCGGRSTSRSPSAHGSATSTSARVPIEEDAVYTVVTNGGLLQGTHRQATFAAGKRHRARRRARSPQCSKDGTRDAGDDSRAGARGSDAGEVKPRDA